MVVYHESLQGIKISLSSQSPLFDSFIIFSRTVFNPIKQHVEPPLVAQKVIQGVYPGVTTMELDE